MSTLIHCQEGEKQVGAPVWQYIIEIIMYLPFASAPSSTSSYMNAKQHTSGTMIAKDCQQLNAILSGTKSVQWYSVDLDRVGGDEKVRNKTEQSTQHPLCVQNEGMAGIDTYLLGSTRDWWHQLAVRKETGALEKSREKFSITNPLRIFEPWEFNMYIFFLNTDHRRPQALGGQLTSSAKFSPPPASENPSWPMHRHSWAMKDSAEGAQSSCTNKAERQLSHAGLHS